MDDRDLNDRGLIKQAQGGDKNALNWLFQCCFQHCRRLAYRFTGDGNIAEDLAQQTNMRLLQVFQQFDFARGTMSAWITRVCLNVCRDWARQNKRRFTLSLDIPVDSGESLAYDLPGSEPTGEDTLLGIERDALVRAVVNQLPIRHRELLVAWYLDEMDYGSIAEAFGISVKTARQRMHEARRCLLRALRPVLHRMDPDAYPNETPRPRRSPVTDRPDPDADPDHEDGIAPDQELKEGCELDELSADQSPVIVLDAPDPPL